MGEGRVGGRDHALALLLREVAEDVAQRVDLGQPLTFVWRRWRPQSPHGGPTGVRGGVSGRKFAPFPLESGWLSTAGQWQHADG